MSLSVASLCYRDARVSGSRPFPTARSTAHPWGNSTATCTARRATSSSSDAKTLSPRSRTPAPTVGVDMRRVWFLETIDVESGIAFSVPYDVPALNRLLDGLENPQGSWSIRSTRTCRLTRTRGRHPARHFGTLTRIAQRPDTRGSWDRAPFEGCNLRSSRPRERLQGIHHVGPFGADHRTSSRR